MTQLLNNVIIYKNKGGERLEKLYKIIEVAEYFKVSRNAVYKWINEKKLKVVKTPGGETRISESEIKKFMEVKWWL